MRSEQDLQQVDERAERSKEQRARFVARRAGFRVCKSRRAFSGNNMGGLQLVDDHNTVVAGSDYDLTADDVVYWVEWAVKRCPEWPSAAFRQERHARQTVV